MYGFHTMQGAYKINVHLQKEKEKKGHILYIKPMSVDKETLNIFVSNDPDHSYCMPLPLNATNGYTTPHQWRESQFCI